MSGLFACLVAMIGTQVSLPSLRKAMSVKVSALPLRWRTCAQSGYSMLPDCFSRRVRFGTSSGRPIAFCLSPGSTSCGKISNGWLAFAPRPALFCVTSRMVLQSRLACPSALRTAVRKAKGAVLHLGHEPLWRNSGSEGGLPVAGTFQCEQCPAVFATAQQLSAHRIGKHGVRCPAARYAGRTTVCKSCLMQFWESSRLLRHLQHDSPKCLAVQDEHQVLEGDLGAWGTPSPPPAQGLPATRLHGPLLPLLSCSVADFALFLLAKAEPASQGGWLSPACKIWLDANRGL